MKNKKGFTLIELLAVIVLLGVVGTIAAVSFSSISKNIKEKQKKNIESRIVLAAQKYVADTGIKKVYVDTLITNGFLEADNESKEIQDPVSKKSMNCNLVDFSEDINNPTIEDGDCSLEKINDSIIFLTYCEITKGESTCTPNLDFSLSAIDNKWTNKKIVLGVNIENWITEQNKDGSSIDESKLTYNWVNPLSPSNTKFGSTFEVEVPSAKNYVDDVYTMRMNYDGKDYIASGKIKVDLNLPQIKNMKSNKSGWASSKQLTATLVDNESGLAGFAITTSSNTPSKWNKISGTNLTVSEQIKKNGIYYLWVKDEAGNVTYQTHNEMYIDSTAPTCIYDGETSIWTTNNRTITLYCKDDGGSECEKELINSKTYQASIKTDKYFGTYTIKDKAGNTAICNRPVSVYVDKTAPSCDITGESTEWTNTNRIISWGCTDSHSGCDSSSSQRSKTYDYSTRTANINTYTIRDNAGNQTTCNKRAVNVYVDKDDPTCTSSGDNETWTNKSVTINWGCDDLLSGCKPNKSGDSKTYSTTTDFSTITSYEIEDKAGNTTLCDSREASIHVDATSPKITTFKVESSEYNYNSIKVDIELVASDNQSGVTSICISESKKSSECNWKKVEKNNKYTYKLDTDEGSGDEITIYAFVKDDSGNVSEYEKEDYTVYEVCSETNVSSTSGYKCTESCGGGKQYYYDYYEDLYLGSDCGKSQKLYTGKKCNTSPCAEEINEYMYDDDCNTYYITECAGGVCSFTYFNGDYEPGEVAEYILLDDPPKSCSEPDDPPEDIGVRYDYDCNTYYITYCDERDCEYTEFNGNDIVGWISRSELRNSPLKTCEEEKDDDDDLDDPGNNRPDYSKPCRSMIISVDDGVVVFEGINCKTTGFRLDNSSKCTKERYDKKNDLAYAGFHDVRPGKSCGFYLDFDGTYEYDGKLYDSRWWETSKCSSTSQRGTGWYCTVGCSLDNSACVKD